MPDERVAIVFGGASGIGRASAEALASQGCRVMVADLNGDAGAATASIIEAGGGVASHVSTDITDEDSVRSAIGATVDRFGTLGVLVTSVGASPGRTGAEGWIRAIDLFLKGPFYASLHGIPELERNGGGAIVHIGSIALDPRVDHPPGRAVGLPHRQARSARIDEDPGPGIRRQGYPGECGVPGLHQDADDPVAA